MIDSPATSGNLPVALTPFIGRGRELVEGRKGLASARLLSLTGPGGCGKTRLALELASGAAADFPDGVWWCDLAAVTDPAYLPQAVAADLLLSPQPGRSPTDALIAALRDRRVLLVLDNCEHLLTACAALAHALLGSCPDLKLLATTLQPLGLAQENAWPVPPLALPRGSESTPPDQADAVRFFVDRARRILPSFDLTSQNQAAVVAICNRLDGLPLALELAAARVRMLTVEQIAERLDDLFRLLTRDSPSGLPRHQTLRAAIDWSHQFLSPAERTLMRRLSVFAGSFTLEMTEAICGVHDAAPDPAVLDLLTDLVEKSLVTTLAREDGGEPRFRVLETIRQYSREKLEEAGETADIRTRHLTWFAAFVQGIEPRLSGPEAGPAIARLEADLDNLRVALQWVRTSRAVEPGLRLAGSLWLFWQSRGYLVEGRNWLEELLALEPAAGAVPAAVRTKALYAAAALAFRQSDLERATLLAEASVAAARKAGDPARVGIPLSLLAVLATEHGDYERAAEMHAEALALYRGLGDATRVSNTLINLGTVARRQGDYRRAVALYEESLASKRRLGDTVGTALVLSNLGEIAVIQGRPAQAAALLEESLLLYREFGSKSGSVAALNNLGMLARYQGRVAEARASFERALEICKAMGDQMRASMVALNLGDLARDQGDWVKAQTLCAEASAQLDAVGDDSLRALALHSLALIAAGRGDLERALELHRKSLGLYRSAAYPLGMVEALEALAEVTARTDPGEAPARWLAAAQARREIMSAPVPEVDRVRHAAASDALRSRPGEAAFSEAWTVGRSLSLEQAVDEALAEDGAAASPAVPVARMPRLRILGLGPARVLIGDRVLAPSDWTYTKSRELLFYLLTRPSATKAQVGLDLWPDASAEQLRSFFHSALHHLRRALGDPGWIEFQSGGYAFNQGLPFDFDVLSFEEHIRLGQSAALAVTQSADRARAIGHLEAAVALWHGDFLEDLDAGDWALFRREALHEAHLNALIQLGELHFAEARYDAAAEHYRLSLSFDAYLELAHRGLMRCHARQGETGKAVRHYQVLTGLLQAELSTAPSPETTLLYERIRRGDDI